MKALQQVTRCFYFSLTLCLVREAAAQVPVQQIASDPLRAEELVKGLSRLDQGRGFLVSAQVLLQRGDVALANSNLDKAASAAEAVGDPDLLGRTCLLRGVIAESRACLKTSQERSQSRVEAKRMKLKNTSASLS